MDKCLDNVQTVAKNIVKKKFLGIAMMTDWSVYIKMGQLWIGGF